MCKLALQWAFLLVFILGCNWNEKTIKNPNNTKPEISDSKIEVLYQNFHATPTTQQEVDENILIEYAIEKNLDVKRTQKGVYINTLKSGKGRNIDYNDPVSVNYTGKFLNDSVFDFSNNPIKFNVGKMIPGWTETLINCRYGDKILVLIPSNLAYGSKGYAEHIPPNTNLIFEIEILDE